MNDLLKHPWVRVLIVATTVAMCSLALRETASITLPIVTALRDVLVPVAIGFTIAYVLTPLVDVLTRRGLPRMVATGVLFAVFSLVMVVGVTVVVPTVIKQSTGIAARLFKGEDFTDRNGNGRYDESEPYIDTNGNARFDGQGMLTNGMKWLEERQGQLRRLARLDLDQPALSFLAYVMRQTAGERALIDAALGVARDGRPLDQWPEALRRNPPVDAPLAWDADWPGATRAAVDDAFARLAPEAQERWIRNLATVGRSYAAKQVELIAALRGVRRNDPFDHTPVLAERAREIRAAFQAQLTPEEEKAVKAFAQRLAEEDKLDQPAARELMEELRGEDRGSQWLAPAVGALEKAIDTSLAALPGRVGGWALNSVSSFDAVLAFALDVLLVPIYAFFLILAMPAVRRGVKEHLPNWHRDQVLRIVRDIEKVVAAFFRGRLIVCLICSVLCYVGFLGVGAFGPSVPYALLFSLLIGLATAVPLAGLLFLVPAVILNLLDGGTGLTAGMMIGVYVVVQVLETVVLTPTIMGHEVELHAVTLIVALLLCGKLLGILGVILAVPIAATGRILAREFLWPWLRDVVSRPRGPTVGP
jgi:predicted PurR-regulated permease PerM